MAKYMFVFRGGLVTKPDASPDQMQAHFQKWVTWFGELQARGEVAGDPLQSGGATLRGPAKTLTDGPYAEMKDLVGGYAILEAESQEAAVELAKGCPIFEDHDNGSVEVRPIADMGN